MSTAIHLSRWLAGAAKGGGATGAMPPWLATIKKHISKDRIKIKENFKTCALKKVYTLRKKEWPLRKFSS